MNIPSAVKLILALGALVLAAGSFFWMAYEIYGLRTEIAELYDEREMVAMRDTYAGTTRMIARDTAPERERLKTLIVGDDMISVVELLEEVGRVAGVSVSSDSISENASWESGAASYPSVVVSLRSTGTFSELYHFLSLIEMLPVALFVEHVRFEFREQEEEESGTWNMLMRVHVLSTNK